MASGSWTCTKRKENTTPFGINFMRSQVLYLAAQVMDLCTAGPEQMTETAAGLCDCQHMPRLHCMRTCEHVRDVPFMLEACGQSVLGSDQSR